MFNLKRIEVIEEWLESGNLKSQTPSSWVKDYVLNEQNYKCALCPQTITHNGKNLVLILDHIDGNADKNCRENLRCVCPNCDSQLPTFKSRNRNASLGRRKRYQMNKDAAVNKDFERLLNEVS